MHLTIAYCEMSYEFIALKFRINLCYILEMQRKKLKIGIAGSNRCIATAGSTNSIVGSVSDRVVNLDVDAYDIDRGSSILDSRSGILSLR